MLTAGVGWQAAASPTSLAVTHRAIEEGRKLADLGKCLEMEFLIAQRFMRGADFFEGVGNMLGLGEFVAAAPARDDGQKIRDIDHTVLIEVGR